MVKGEPNLDDTNLHEANGIQYQEEMRESHNHCIIARIWNNQKQKVIERNPTADEIKNGERPALTTWT